MVGIIGKSVIGAVRRVVFRFLALIANPSVVVLIIIVSSGNSGARSKRRRAGNKHSPVSSTLPLTSWYIPTSRLVVVKVRVFFSALNKTLPRIGRLDVFKDRWPTRLIPRNKFSFKQENFIDCLFNKLVV